MGIVQIPAPVAGVTRNVVAFTSTQTWTVPSSAKYVDVLVVGGGTGGRGGYRGTFTGDGGANNAGAGGGITLMNNIFLNGTGTVSIVVGAGSNGTTGTATTTSGANASAAGWSGFGTFCYSQGSVGSNVPGLPGYKGTIVGNLQNYNINTDSTLSNWAPMFQAAGNSSSRNFYAPDGNFDTNPVLTTINAVGMIGGSSGSTSGSVNAMRAGGHPGMNAPGSGLSFALYTNTFPQSIFNPYFNFIGTATAGTSGGGSGAVGAAGQLGFAGGGGTAGAGVNLPGGQGGPGAGGGPSTTASTGANAGNGGNAGTNTGAGGGGGGLTGSTGAGTGGNGGNGAAGIVIVSWLS